MRVLEPDGLLVFKWNEDQIALSKVLKVFETKPLLGDQRGENQMVDFYKITKKKIGDVRYVIQNLH